MLLFVLSDYTMSSEELRSCLKTDWMPGYIRKSVSFDPYTTLHPREKLVQKVCGEREVCVPSMTRKQKKKARQKLDEMKKKMRVHPDSVANTRYHYEGMTSRERKVARKAKMLEANAALASMSICSGEPSVVEDEYSGDQESSDDGYDAYENGLFRHYKSTIGDVWKYYGSNDGKTDGNDDGGRPKSDGSKADSSVADGSVNDSNDADKSVNDSSEADSNEADSNADNNAANNSDEKDKNDNGKVDCHMYDDGYEGDDERYEGDHEGYDDA